MKSSRRMSSLHHSESFIRIWPQSCRSLHGILLQRGVCRLLETVTGVLRHAADPHCICTKHLDQGNLTRQTPLPVQLCPFLVNHIKYGHFRGLYSFSLRANVTSSTKPEVHNSLSQFCQRRTESQAIGNVRKIW